MTFRVLAPSEVARRMPELADISHDWLRARADGTAVLDRVLRSRRTPPLSAVPSSKKRRSGGRLLAFAEPAGRPRRDELSVDLMRHRAGRPARDGFPAHLAAARGQAPGYRGSTSGWRRSRRSASSAARTLRERLARLHLPARRALVQLSGRALLQGEVQSRWVPRYMAYQDAWEWPVAIAYVSALIAGGWNRIPALLRRFEAGAAHRSRRPAAGRAYLSLAA